MKILNYLRGIFLSITLLCTVACTQTQETTPSPSLAPTTQPVETAPSQSASTQDNTPDPQPETSPDSANDSLALSFETTTLTGDTLSSDLFQDYDLTMVNIWATWCGPCVNEMPDLQKVHQSLPENVNFLTICDDGESKNSLATDILQASNATFQTLLPNDQIKTQLMSGVRAFPTTIFVNSQGILVGTVLEGAPSDDVVETYLTIIETILETL